MQVYLQTEAGLARVWDELWLTSDQRDSAAAAVEGIQHWIAGNHVWASSLALDAVVPRDE
jgi:germacradienol/geosmin synthase